MKPNTQKTSRALRILRTSFNKSSRRAEQRLQNFFVGMGRWAQQNRFQVVLTAFVVLALLLVFVEVNVSEVLFGEENKARGELLKFVAVILGAGLIIWGLYINNRRIQEQTRQNEIAEQGQISMRFKDGAMLLNSPQTGVVLSGIYALNAIAEDAARTGKNGEYVKVIYDIFCAILRERNALEVYEKVQKLAPTVVTQTLLDTIFKGDKNIYRHYRSNLSKCMFKNINFYDLNVVNADFVHSKFQRVSFMNYKLEDAAFVNAELDEVTFSLGGFSKVEFLRARLSDVVFGQAEMQRVSFYEAVFRNVDFGSTTLQGVAFDHTTLADIPYPKIVEKGRSLELTRATMLF